MKKLIFLFLYLLIFFSFCKDTKQALVGNWNCEVLLGEESSISFNYKMSFTKEKQWIPDISKNLKLNYDIKDKKIVTKSDFGLNIYSEYSLFRNKLKIDTLGLLSECTRE
jgi:hypothetical protein